jgi:hypothetical protein
MFLSASSMVIIKFALHLVRQTPEGSDGWMKDLLAITRQSPVAYVTKGVEMQFLDGTGNIVGRFTPKQHIFRMRQSPSGTYTAFLCVDNHLYVVDSLGHVCYSRLDSPYGISLFWTRDDRLLMSQEELEEVLFRGLDGKLEDHAMVSVSPLHLRADEIVTLSGNGRFAFAGFHNQSPFLKLMHGGMVPNWSEGFWLDTSYKKTGRLLPEQEFEALAASGDGSYLSAIISRNDLRQLVVFSPSNQKIVMRLMTTRSLIDVDPCWSPIGHQLAILSESPGARYNQLLRIYDLDTGKVRKYSVPQADFRQLAWIDSKTLAAVGSDGRGISCRVLNVTNGKWSVWPNATGHYAIDFLRSGS